MSTTRDWIYGVVEDALSDVLGVIEMFDVDQNEAVAILDESLDWLRGDPLQALVS